MNRVLLVPLALVTFAMGHTPRPLPMAEVIVVSQRPLSLFNLSDQRDSLVVREARRQGVPEWLALSIAHAENWGGDSTAVNPYSGAIGLLQIHPINWELYATLCGTAHITDRRRNVCVGVAILKDCLSPILEETLSCFGGAVSPTGRRNYNYDVNRQVRLGWID